MRQPNTFLSFSHNDIAWAERLQTHLQVAGRKGAISFWDDRQIRAGDRWADEIQKALDSSSVAVLLISPDFLASDFIADVEVPSLLRHQENEGLVVLPVLVRPCLWHEVEWL